MALNRFSNHDTLRRIGDGFVVELLSPYTAFFARRGSTTDGHNRWPDCLARRLAVERATAGVAVLNLGIGGNGLFGGLGPPATARFERDVLSQAGVRWVIVFEGVNDIGAGRDAEAIARAYGLLVRQARARNLRVYGATLTPFAGHSYHSPAREAARQKVNDWIRSSGTFDAVIDFDAAARDPQAPGRLLQAYDSGDGLHLNPAGYQALAEAVEVKLFGK